MPLPITCVRSPAASDGPGLRATLRVARESVEPHVDDLARVVGHRQAPTVRARCDARHAEIANLAGEKREGLGARCLGHDLQAAGFDRGADRLAVARQPEEPVVLVHELRRGAVLVADGDVVVDECFAAGTITTDPRRLVEVGRACAPQSFDRRAMARIARGLDEVVGRAAEQRCERAKRGGVAIDELLSRHAFARGRDRVLQAVVVGAGREPDVAARATGDGARGCRRARARTRSRGAAAR